LNIWESCKKEQLTKQQQKITIKQCEGRGKKIKPKKQTQVMVATHQAKEKVAN
jgi:hypothetical protein